MAPRTTKTRTEFVCNECGGTTAKWQGQCPHCKAWNTLQEFKVAQGIAARYGAGSPRSAGGFVDTTGSLQDLSDVAIEEIPRTVTGLGEFDRVMGGGLVKGCVALIGGDPGIGKSTLLLQVMARLVELGHSALYVSGEESPTQIALRAQRLQLEPRGLTLMSEIELEHIESVISSRKPEYVVIDSIQTIFSSQLDSAPGSVSQVRECAARLTRMAKTVGTTLIFVGHVTKDGSLAGPRILEHIVDTVLYFEGDQHSNFRLVRAFQNRFGAVNELGVFAMTDHGLRGVTNPSAIFLSDVASGAMLKNIVDRAKTKAVKASILGGDDVALNVELLGEAVEDEFVETRGSVMDVDPVQWSRINGMDNGRVVRIRPVPRKEKENMQ